MRHDQREYDELRAITMTPGYIKHPEGSVMIECGDTKVICNASIEDRVPPFMRGQKKGWITAEYAMLPRATQKRNIRESSKGKVSGRTMEIQRLIGRALRSVVDLNQIGERTVWVDCDVLQADGGTRTASITGAFVAVVLAFDKLLQNGTIKKMPVTDYMAAVSVGIATDESALLDLNYDEDSKAAVDMNVVMTGANEFIEIQGTGEEATFTGSQLQTMLGLAEKGMQELNAIQKTILGSRGDRIGETKQAGEDSHE